MVFRRHLVIDLDATIVSSTSDERASTQQCLDLLKQWQNSDDYFQFEKSTVVCLRPGVVDFLKNIRNIFKSTSNNNINAKTNEEKKVDVDNCDVKIIIYTHGCRSYANSIRAKIDPDWKLIDQVYSMDDEPRKMPMINSNTTSQPQFTPLLKDLRRINPQMTLEEISNTLIIDDRPEVWVQCHQVIPIYQFNSWNLPRDPCYILNYPWSCTNQQRYFFQPSFLKTFEENSILSCRVKLNVNENENPEEIFNLNNLVDNVLTSLEHILRVIIYVQNQNRSYREEKETKIIRRSTKFQLSSLGDIDNENIISLDFLWMLYKKNIYRGRVILFMDQFEMIREEYFLAKDFGADVYLWSDLKKSINYTDEAFRNVENSITHIIFARSLKDTLQEVYTEFHISQHESKNNNDNDGEEGKLLSGNFIRPFSFTPRHYAFHNIRSIHFDYAHFGVNIQSDDYDDFHRYRHECHYHPSMFSLKVDYNQYANVDSDDEIDIIEDDNNDDDDQDNSNEDYKITASSNSSLYNDHEIEDEKTEIEFAFEYKITHEFGNFPIIRYLDSSQKKKIDCMINDMNELLNNSRAIKKTKQTLNNCKVIENRYPFVPFFSSHIRSKIEKLKPQLLTHPFPICLFTT